MNPTKEYPHLLGTVRMGVMIAVSLGIGDRWSQLLPQRLARSLEPRCTHSDDFQIAEKFHNVH